MLNIHRNFWILLGTLLLPGLAYAQVQEQFLPAALKETKLTEHLDEKLPLDLVFTDDHGDMVRLGDCFPGDVPVILSMNYSNCPMLCVLQLNGLVDSLREINLVAGKDFRVISVSLDARETPAKAAETKSKYIQSYGERAVADGWHFLTGTEESISTLAEAIGLEYVYMPEKREYSHPAVFCVTTPKGILSRYHYGVEFPPKTLRLSLVEAGEGKIGTTFDQFLLICFHYDETEGRYAPTARNLMKIGGAIAIVGIGGLIWICQRKSQDDELASDTNNTFGDESPQSY